MTDLDQNEMISSCRFMCCNTVFMEVPESTWLQNIETFWISSWPAR